MHCIISQFNSASDNMECDLIEQATVLTISTIDEYSV